MFICYISTSRTWRGGESQLLYLLNYIKNAGISLVLICPNASPLYHKAKVKKIPVKGIPRYASLLISLWTLLRLKITQNNILFHANDSAAHTLLILVNLFIKIPFLVHRRVNFKKKKKHLTLYKYNHPQLKALICVSKSILNMQKPILKRNLSTVIYDSINIDEYTIKSSETNLLTTHNIKKSQKIIANISALTHEKDHITYVKMANLVLKKRKDIHFFIIGKGPEEKKIKELIQTMRLGKWITLTGFRDDIKEILRTIDSIVITSKEEGLNSSILEAFASNCPVVATDAGGIPELIKHEKTGLLSPIENPEALAKNLLRLLENTTLKNNIIKQARAYVEEFDISKIGHKTLRLYKEIEKKTHNYST